METLSEAAKRLETTLKETTQSKDTSPMPPLGSTNDAGRWNIPLAEPEEVLPLEMQIKVENPRALAEALTGLLQNGKPQPIECLEKSNAVKYSKEEKGQFTIALMQLFQMLREYGKQGQDFDIIVQGFLIFFERKGYSMQMVVNALFQYLDRSKEIPTPADIENIINPPLPKIDWALYIELKKRLREGRVYVDQDEKRFLRECEDIGVNRLRGEMQNYTNAQAELERFDVARLQSWE